MCEKVSKKEKRQLPKGSRNLLVKGIFGVVCSAVIVTAHGNNTNNTLPITHNITNPCDEVSSTGNIVYNAQNLYEKYPWSVLYYYGITSTRTLAQTVQFKFDSAGEYIDTLELAYTLSKSDNFLRYLPNPLVIELAANVTYRNGAEDDNSAIWEFDPYLILRWTSFPWNKFIATTLGFAEGVSYDTAVPGLEIHSASDPNIRDNAGHLLNYLMFETTLALPKYPRLQLVIRIHHRSGAYGLYGVGNAGSNVIGLGIRYLF